VYLKVCHPTKRLRIHGTTPFETVLTWVAKTHDETSFCSCSVPQTHAYILIEVESSSVTHMR